MTATPFSVLRIMDFKIKINYDLLLQMLGSRSSNHSQEVQGSDLALHAVYFEAKLLMETSSLPVCWKWWMTLTGDGVLL